MIRSAIFPNRYVQGRDAIHRIGELIEPFGNSALLLVDRNVRGCVELPISESLLDTRTSLEIIEFGGECTRDEIESVAEMLRAANISILIGAGGGKTIDTAKAAAMQADSRVVIVPTTASTDAPTSALSVIYTSDGAFREYRFLPRNPDLVLMDTRMIADAPVRFLVAGMGDALATWFEADASFRSGALNMAGGLATQAGMAIARLCYDTLIEYGPLALMAVSEKAITPPLERIVEANTLLSGIGFESGGLAAAHSIHNGLTALPETHRYLHGEKVAFGVLTQLVLENASPQVFDDVLAFMAMVGLPATLESIGLGDASRAKLGEVADLATMQGETIHNEPFAVTSEEVVDALIAADALGRSFPAGASIGEVISEREAA